MINIEIPREHFREKVSQHFIKDKKVRYEIIGYSNCERKIESFSIGNSGKKILLSACYHGLEWITYLVLIKFLDEILENNIKCENIMTIVPCVNPDGVEISLFGEKSAKKYEELVKQIGKTDKWQSNARGVDINHNFDAGWKALRKLEIENNITGASNTRYGGKFPESEPETKSIVNLCERDKFDLAFAFHSQGEEIYWNYGKKTPKESEKIAKKIAEITEYKISSPVKLAIGGGFKDWFIEKFEKPGFTLELGKGQNPLPIEQFEEIFQKISPLLFYLSTKKII